MDSQGKVVELENQTQKVVLESWWSFVFMSLLICENDAQVLAVAVWKWAAETLGDTVLESIWYRKCNEKLWIENYNSRE